MSTPSSSAALSPPPHDFTGEELAALRWVLGRKEEEPSVLCLCAMRFGPVHQRYVQHHSSREHVHALWNMTRGKREFVWRALGQYDSLEALVLGHLPCPMGKEELLSLLPSRSCPLAKLRTLLLQAIPKADDTWLQALGNAGCGQNLTELSLFALREGVTDRGLQVLADAGCGPNLMSLHLEGLQEGVTDQGLSALVGVGCGPNLAALHLEGLQGVTNSGLRALAEAGCGSNLTTLTASDLNKGVTDQGLHALAAAGCGRRLKFEGNSGGGHATCFPAILGLPREFHDARRFSLQQAYCHWRRRQDQWLFLNENVQHLGNSPAAAVLQWDEEHQDPEDKVGPHLFAWAPRAQELVMRWSLPVEVWQEVLAFCPFVEYVRLAGVRATKEEGATWPASREFYHLLKHSLLEMRFRATLPSACLGGLWIASRALQASPVRELWLEKVKRPGSSMSTINEVVPLKRLHRMHIVVSKWDQCLQEEVLWEAAAPFVQDSRKLLVIEE